MLNILIIVAAFLIAVVLARIIIPRILIISLRKRLFDTPDARKVHKKPVSRLGGVSFFPAILFTVTFLIGICYMTGWVLLSGYRTTLGTDTVYVYRVDIAVYCGNCG